MRRREAFTIVELLVAFALIIFIMVILTEAFAAGLESFRQLKSIGDMQEKMRAVYIVMRRDLSREHFEDDRGTRLSDIDLRASSAPVNDPPDNGYFRIWQRWDGTRPNASQLYNQNNPSSVIWSSTLEGIDSTLTPLTRATDQGMSFTVRLHGPMPSDYFTAPLPGNPATSPNPELRAMSPPDFQTSNAMHSQWAEVSYFLRPVGRTAGSTPLYALYRRQRLLSDKGGTASCTPAQFNDYPEVSFSPTPDTSGNHPLNNIRSITEPHNRFGATPSAPGGPYNFNRLTLEQTLPANDARIGDDLMLTDVISFEIRAIYQGFPSTFTAAGSMAYFADLPPITYAGTPNAPYHNTVFQPPNDNLCVFDTWSKYGAYSGWDSSGTPTSLPLKVRILALQVTLRVHDSKTGLTRQTSIIQDM